MTTHISLTLSTLFMGYHTENNGSSSLNSLWFQNINWEGGCNLGTTVKCRCNERQYNEMFRIVKLFSGPVPFPYLICVKTFHFNEFRTFSITN